MTNPTHLVDPSGPASDAVQGPAFETSITRLFGITHPILCGGLMWLADARYVAAALPDARDLIGPDLRLHTTKLNMKKAEYGAPVQWHQDFAFYPHTNDDVLAVGIVFDELALENGPLQVFPGSHKGPILDHHSDGVFAGAVDIAASGLDLADAVSLTGPAGTVTIHHGRLLHGSALNTSKRDRQMLFYEMMAADAFPVMGALTKFESIEQYDSLMLCGETTLTPRLEPIPVRIPQPQPLRAGSIYEIQEQQKAKAFQTYEDRKADT